MVMAALRARDRPVEYLELAVEGPEERRLSSRGALLERLVRFLTERLSSPAQ